MCRAGFIMKVLLGYSTYCSFMVFGFKVLPHGISKYCSCLQRTARLLFQGTALIQSTVACSHSKYCLIFFKVLLAYQGTVQCKVLVCLNNLWRRVKSFMVQYICMI